MSWHVRIKVVTKRYSKGWQLVFDEYSDKLKDNVCRGGGLDFPGVEKRLYDVPEEVRKLVETEAGTGWEYHDANTLGKIEEKFRAQLYSAIGDRARIEHFVSSPEYWKLTEKEKKNVEKDLMEARGRIEYGEALWGDAKMLLDLVSFFEDETYMAIAGEG